MSNLIEKLTAVIESDSDSDSVRLWLWLFLNGEQLIEDVLLCPLPNLVPSLNALVASERLKVDGRTLTATIASTPSEATPAPVKDKTKRMSKRLRNLNGFERTREALENPRLLGAKEVLDEGAEYVFRAFNNARKEKRLLPVPASQLRGSRDKWLRILKFCVKHDVKPAELIEFACQKTKHHGRKFPAVGVIAGDWLQQEWIDRGGTADAHAGHTYTATESTLRTRLRLAGHEAVSELDEDKLRHIVKLAELERDTPHLRKTHKDEQSEAAIVWIAKEGI